MKIEKTKHDHKLTHLLKVGIFAMLMVAPLFASCSQLMYVTFNKNAYQSTQITGVEYYTTYEYETNEVNSVDDLVAGNIYHIELALAGNNANILSVYGIYNLETSIGSKVNVKNESAMIIRNDSTNIIYIRASTYGDNVALYNIGGQLSCDIVYGDLLESYYKNLITFSASDYLGETTVHERPIQALDNAFYYGVEKMTESPLFNWTQNTALYTGIKAMTDNLQVQTNVIAVLVTYWTILTIIYIIIDIVLALFTKMTHLLVRSD